MSEFVFLLNLPFIQSVVWVFTVYVYADIWSECSFPVGLQIFHYIHPQMSHFPGSRGNTSKDMRSHRVLFRISYYCWLGPYKVRSKETHTSMAKRGVISVCLLKYFSLISHSFTGLMLCHSWSFCIQYTGWAERQWPLRFNIPCTALHQTCSQVWLCSLSRIPAARSCPLPKSSQWRCITLLLYGTILSWSAR